MQPRRQPLQCESLAEMATDVRYGFRDRRVGDLTPNGPLDELRNVFHRNHNITP